MLSLVPGETASYALYFGAIIASTALAQLAYSFPLMTARGPRVNPVYWTLSFGVLWFVMGFRFEVGTDYASYQRIYDHVAEEGFLGYYKTGGILEPAYILLAWLVSVTLGEFVGLFICSSFLGLYFVYKTFSNEARFINPAYCIFIYGTTNYFYYFGIDRFFIAMAIFASSLRYIPANRVRLYIICVLLSACFHYSALFLLCIPLIFKRLTSHSSNMDKYNDKLLKTSFWRLVIRYAAYSVIVFILFYSLHLISVYLPERYSLSNNDEAGGTSIWSVLLRMPILCILIVALRRVTQYNAGASIYFISYLLSFAILLASLIYPGLGRLNWYFWISSCLVFSYAYTSYGLRSVTGVAIFCFGAIYSALYLIYAFLGHGAFRSQFMFPYKNIFFEL